MTAIDVYDEVMRVLRDMDAFAAGSDLSDVRNRIKSARKSASVEFQDQFKLRTDGKT